MGIPEKFVKRAKQRGPSRGHHPTRDLTGSAVPPFRQERPWNRRIAPPTDEKEQAERSRLRHMAIVLRIGDRLFRGFNNDETQVFTNWSLGGAFLYTPWNGESLDYAKAKIKEITGIDPIEVSVSINASWKAPEAK